MVISIHKTYLKYPRGWGITSKEPIWIFDINYVTQNNSYIQLLAPLCSFLPLFRDLCQTSTKCFVKSAVVHDFYLGLLRFFLTIGGGLSGQIFNFPLECSTTSWQGSFVVVEKFLSTPMSI